MKTACIGMALLFLVAGLLALPPADHAGQTPAVGAKIVDNDTYIDANRILMFVTNHGNFGRDLAHIFGYDYGTFFPYAGDTSLIRSGAMKNSPLYAAGLWVGGKVDGQIRVTVAEYDDEYVPGPMNGDSPGSPQYRVYKLYADSLASNPNTDYLEWPIWDGAPVDGQGHPRVIGQQTLWSVFNDADPAQHIENAGMTEPLGIEVQQTVWAASEPGTDTAATPLALVVTHVGTTGITVAAYAVDATVTLDDYLVEIAPHAELGHVWRLKNLSTGQILLDDQTTFSGEMSPVVEGVQVAVTAPIGDWKYDSAEPANWSPVAVADNGYNGGRWFTGWPDNGGDIFYGGVFMEPHFWGFTSVSPGDINPVELRFRPMLSYTDLNGNGRYDIGEPYVVDDPSQTQNAFMYSSFSGDTYEGFSPIPFTAWDISDPDNPRQINVVVRDRDQNHQWDLQYQTPSPDYLLPNAGDQRFNYFWTLITDYDPTGTRYGNGTGGTIDFWGYDNGNGIWDAMWAFWLYPNEDYGMLAEEAAFRVYPNILYAGTRTDSFTFTSVRPPFVVSGQEHLAVYLQYKLFNKGANQIDSCYLALWSDPDLGGSGDDLVGCDTLHDLFFCYNANNADQQYGAEPPAIGFKFLYGPVIPSANDTAFFDGALMPGHQNLRMTSFQKYINGTDPDDFMESFNYMQGLDRNGAPLANGTHYAVPGDPVTYSGEIDIAPQDRRMMGTCGPFTFNPGDSQYVLVKMAVGQGTDRLNSITKLREVLNGQPTLGPDPLMAILRPEPQYVFYQNAIDPMMDTVYLGRVRGSAVGVVDYGTLRINSEIIPTSVGRLQGYPGFSGDVLQIIFPAKQFIAGYGLLWGATNHPFVVTGSFGPDDPTSIGGAIQMIGHIPGDANGDMKVTVGDAVYVVSYVFRDGAAPSPAAMGDANGDGNVNIGDAVYIVGYLFRGGPAPRHP